MLKNVKKVFKTHRVSDKKLAKVMGGKKSRRCQVYNNGMPTGMYTSC